MSAAKNFIPEEIANLEPLTPADEDLVGIQKKCLTSTLKSPLLNFLGKAYFKRGYHNRAQYVFTLLLEEDPKRWRALESLARCQLALGNRTDAIETLAKLLERNDVSRKTVEWANMELQAITDDVADEALASMERNILAPITEDEVKPITEINDALIDVLEKRKIVTYLGSNIAQLERVEQQVQKQPDNPDLLDWYAFLLYSNRRIPEAIDVYERLISEFEATDNALYYLGSAHLKMFNIRSATNIWLSLTQKFPGSSLVNKVSEKLGRLDDIGEVKKQNKNAIRSLLSKIQKALDELPKPEVNIVGQEQSSVEFTDMNATNDQSVLADVEALLENDPNNPEFLDWAAFIHYCNGSFSEAKDYYERVLACGADTPYAFYYIGAIYYRTGQDKEAEQYWKKLLDKFPEHTLANKAKDKLDALAAGNVPDLD